jgi:hypothetical protein
VAGGVQRRLVAALARGAVRVGIHLRHGVSGLVGLAGRSDVRVAGRARQRAGRAPGDGLRRGPEREVAGDGAARSPGAARDGARARVGPAGEHRRAREAVGAAARMAGRAKDAGRGVAVVRAGPARGDVGRRLRLARGAVRRREPVRIDRRIGGRLSVASREEEHRAGQSHRSDMPHDSPPS